MSKLDESADGRIADFLSKASSSCMGCSKFGTSACSKFLEAVEAGLPADQLSASIREAQETSDADHRDPTGKATG